MFNNVYEAISTHGILQKTNKPNRAGLFPLGKTIVGDSALLKCQVCLNLWSEERTKCKEFEGL